MEFELKNNYKICIVIPYFGNWPKWINFFLLSCKYNESIDWHFFSDCGIPDVFSNNLTFHQMTLNEFNELASAQLGIEIIIKNPYKLCDLKPGYGLIFQEYLKGYDFWGYGDIDLIYGNIRHFVTEKILSECDIVSNHHEFIAGHLCFLRNSNEINELFMIGGSYKKAFSQSKYIGFDEQILTFKISTRPLFLKLNKKINTNYHLFLNYMVNSPIKKIIRPFWRKIKRKEINPLQDFTSIVKNLHMKKKIKVRFKTTFQSDLMLKKKRFENWEILWNNGYLINIKEEKEILYFHFLLSKNTKKFLIKKFNPSVNRFIIDKTGIKEAIK